MDPFSPLSLDLIRAFQSLGAWLSVPMKFFTFLGNEEFFLFLLPLVYWCISKALGTDLVVLLIASTGVNGLAKGLLKLPRPYWVEPKLALSSEDSFGMPSGHAMNSTVLWGFPAVVTPWRQAATRGPDRWAFLRPLLILVILLVSVSRLYLGMHSPGHLLGGWLLGALTLAVYLWLRRRVPTLLAGLSIGMNVLLAAVTAFIVLALYLVAAAVPTGDPATYGSLFAIALGQVYEGGGTIAGMILGLWSGLVLERRYVRFVATGPWAQRALRYVLGMIGVVVLWGGLKMLFPTEPLALGLALRVVRYALLMLWTAFLWPWLFVKLGWGTKQS
ncbi:MAG: phosphatase PAP2 family protein [Chloroflexi bacterium]|nr:phosphatase PAP2 family protein [Chloroflexota bacterium]